MDIFQIECVNNIISEYCEFIKTNEWYEKYKYLIIYETNEIDDIPVKCKNLFWKGKNVDLSNTNLKCVEFETKFSSEVIFPKSINKIILDEHFSHDYYISINVNKYIKWKRTPGFIYFGESNYKLSKYSCLYVYFNREHYRTVLPTPPFCKNILSIGSSRDIFAHKNVVGYCKNRPNIKIFKKHFKVKVEQPNIKESDYDNNVPELCD